MQYNFAAGTEFSHAFGPHADIHASVFQALFRDQSPHPIYDWTKGDGIFGILRLRLHEYALSINYWEGNRFQAPMGERLYQSEGRKNVGNPLESRQNLMIRLANELKVAKGLYFMSRLGVNINLDHDQTDVIMENYLRWHIRGRTRQLHSY